MIQASVSPIAAASGDDTESFVRSAYVLYPSDNPLHAATKLENTKAVYEIMKKQPGLASRLNQDGYTPLHLACWAGHIEIVSILIQACPQLCLTKDRYGRTPLDTASMKGRLDIIQELLQACPGCVAEATPAGETAIHAAVTHDQVKASITLLKWLKGKSYCSDIVNTRDCSGNTVLHLATSRKQFQTIKYLLASPFNNRMDLVDVNAMNNSGFTALDILHVLPPRGKIDMEIEKLLRRAGAIRGKDKIKVQSQNKNVYINFKNNLKNSSPFVRPENGVGDAHYALLLVATVIATTSFQAALNPPGSVEDGEKFKVSIRRAPQLMKQSSYLSNLFILFNSITFYTSVALMMIITQEFPLKPWLVIPVFALNGAYICTVMAVSPPITGTVLLLGGLITLAASAQSISLQKLVFKYLHCDYFSRKRELPMSQS